MQPANSVISPQYTLSQYINEHMLQPENGRGKRIVQQNTRPYIKHQCKCSIKAMLSMPYLYLLYVGWPVAHITLLRIPSIYSVLFRIMQCNSDIDH